MNINECEDMQLISPIQNHTVLFFAQVVVDHNISSDSSATSFDRWRVVSGADQSQLSTPPSSALESGLRQMLPLLMRGLPFYEYDIYIYIYCVLNK